MSSFTRCILTCLRDFSAVFDINRFRQCMWQSWAAYAFRSYMDIKMLVSTVATEQDEFPFLYTELPFFAQCFLKSLLV